MAKAFIDTNVLIYLISADATKADRAEAVVNKSVTISVQVLNEIANVVRRKLKLDWQELNEILQLVGSLCIVESLTAETHKKGIWLAERYGFSIYDAMVVSSALLAGCDRLYSEDMQDGLLIEGQLRICNPFTNPIS